MLLFSPDSSGNSRFFFAGIVTDSGTMLTKKQLYSCSKNNIELETNSITQDKNRFVLAFF
jgi:hypothetical protein